MDPGRRYNAAETFIDANRAARPDRIAIRCQGASVTYAQLGANVDRAGNALRSLGVLMEQRVVMQILDSPAFKQDGRFLVSYGAFKGHCSLFPASANVLEAHGEELAPYFSGKGTLRFTTYKPIPSALVKKIVKTRLEENAALTRRRTERT